MVRDWVGYLSQQQGHRVATPEDGNLSNENLRTAAELQESMTSGSSSSDQKEMRRSPSPPLSKSVGVSSWRQGPRMLDLWRRAPRQKPDTDLRQKPDTDSKQNAEAQCNHSNRRNVLILGASDTGKSTLLKGLELVLEGDYTTGERLACFESIQSDIVVSIWTILEAMRQMAIPLGDKRNEYHVRTIYSQLSDYDDNELTYKAIFDLWHDSGVQSAYERRAEYQLNGRALYYATTLKRLIKSNYIPNAEDTLWSRTMTTGVHKTVFEGQPSTAGIEYWFYDVGGTPVERKKWIHAFELGISTVIFTVDTTAYPKLLWEDNTVNRMQGDLTLFSSLVSSPWLTRSNLIVLFTKLDLLEECLRREPAHQYFSDYIYEGSELGIVEHYMEYLKGRFLSLIESDEVLSRTRTIQVNLVDVESQDQRMEVIRILNELTAMYPEISGFYENDMDFWKALPFPNMY
ncbi:hypothetical protein CHU98_g5973 [Xylaria longipes]|nr:hypothetical protein CHU98_g5973 [Xylaria longipes]